MTPRRPPAPLAPGLGLGLSIASLIFGLIVLLIMLIVWWRIFSKAGYSGALSLLMFVPLANVILLFVFAFGTWPIEREIERLRALAQRRPE